VLGYLADLLGGGRKISTARRHLTSIGAEHRRQGLAVGWHARAWAALDAAQRERGEQAVGKRAITISELRRMIGAWDQGRPIDARNRAVLALGFASALRRSSLATLDLADVRFEAEGVVLTIHRDKTDQLGQGRLVGVARGKHPRTCPVRLLEQWIQVRGAARGPLFLPVCGGHVEHRRMRARQVAAIVKRSVERIGGDPASYGAHSLRSGFVTAAVESNVNEFLIAAQTGHRSLATLRRYFRQSNPLRGNASAMIGL
jgi:integrase